MVASDPLCPVGQCAPGESPWWAQQLQVAVCGLGARPPPLPSGALAGLCPVTPMTPDTPGYGTGEGTPAEIPAAAAESLLLLARTACPAGRFSCWQGRSN